MQHGNRDNAAIRIFGDEFDGRVQIRIAHVIGPAGERHRHAARALPTVNLHIYAGVAEITLVARQKCEGIGRLEGPIEREAQPRRLGAGHHRCCEDCRARNERAAARNSMSH